MSAEPTVALATPTVIRIPFSHYCRKVEWALTACGITYDALDVSPRGMRQWTAHLPKGTVPVLVTDDGLIGESKDILAWANKHRNPSSPSLYPRGAKKWESWADAELGPVARREAYRCIYERPSQFSNRKLWHVAFRALRSQVLAILKFYKARRFEEADRAFVHEAVATIAAGLNDKPFLGGEAPHAGDFACAALFAPLVLIRDHPARELPDWNIVAAYVARVRPKTTTMRHKKWARAKDLAKFVAAQSS